jgi:hypothetical protein
MSGVPIWWNVKFSEFPPGSYFKCSDVVCRLDSYVRSDPRFINVTLVASGDRVVIDSNVLGGVISKLSPLELLAHQAQKQTKSVGE